MPRILLIEDNESNGDLISRYLALFDNQVQLAVNGQEGLGMAQADPSKFDLVLMDMNLPEIDGWEVTRRLKGNAETHALPVIAITAHAMVGDREKALAAGCDDYVPKPYSPRVLLAKIREYLPAEVAK